MHILAGEDDTNNAYSSVPMSKLRNEHHSRLLELLIRNLEINDSIVFSGEAAAGCRLRELRRRGDIHQDR